MTKAMEDISLMGVKISNSAPAFNHLLLADDSLFFSLANERAAKKLKYIFGLYEAVSGQAINLSKSSITFGAKVNDTVKARMQALLGIYNDGGIVKYLGLREQVGSKNIEMFAYIIDKVRSITQSWKQRHLSNGVKKFCSKLLQLRCQNIL